MSTNDLITFGYQMLVPVNAVRNSQDERWYGEQAKSLCARTALLNGHTLAGEPKVTYSALVWVPDWHGKGQGEYITPDLVKTLGIEANSNTVVLAFYADVVCHQGPPLRRDNGETG